jgi:hypothetical protein
MSYLNALRLHFAGQFQANVSTVNNTPTHFNNEAFRPSDAKLNPDQTQGSWNPQGDAAFRLLGCNITSAWMPAGQVPTSDPVLHCFVADNDRGPPAKLVDLDSEQQLVSTIWGLTVRIADAEGNSLLQGDYVPAAFTDLWARSSGGSDDDFALGSMFQSVLENLVWGDVSSSPFLAALRTASAGSGRLSIKFNVDGFDMRFTSPSFACGRIVGTIGPATAAEPQHLVMGRQLMAAFNGMTPADGLNYCAAIVDTATSALYLDLGNALPTVIPGGVPVDLGPLAVNAGTTLLGTLSDGPGSYSQDPTWYSRTAGVVVFPLTQSQLQAAAATPLVITGNSGTTIGEWPNGAYVRADSFVYRLSPDDKVEIPVYAMQWGQPLSGVGVTFALDRSVLQMQGGGGDPPVGTPETVLRYTPTQNPFPPSSLNPGETSPPVTVTTDTQGVALLPITATDPGTPRYFKDPVTGQKTVYGIDGQIYGIAPSFADVTYAGPGTYPQNQWNFISFLVWSGFTPSNPVSGTDLYPIFQQYANLYPVMSRFVDLANYDQVVAYASFLQFAFGLDQANPNTMPVTRDLSPAKRAAILSWLQKPNRGSWPLTPPLPPDGGSAAVPQAPDRGGMPPPGGKTAALARRIGVQKS